MKARCCDNDRCADKERAEVQWHKTRGVLSAVHPCGVVAELREMFVHESRLQVCAMIEDLWHTTSNYIRRFGYDDGCHLHESIEKAANEGSTEASNLLTNCDIFIDPWHLRGHKRKTCTNKFSPRTRPWATKKTWKLQNKPGGISTNTGTACDTNHHMCLSFICCGSRCAATSSSRPANGRHEGMS